MSAIVPVVPAMVVADGVRSGRPVRGGDAQWRSYGATLNHLIGRGSTLIPHSFINTEIDQNATTTLQLYVWPRAVTRRRLWVMTYGVSSAFSMCLVRFTDPSGGTSDATINAPSAAGSTLTHYHVEDVTSPATNELAPTWTEVNDVGAPKLLWLACFDLPRPELSLTSGIDLDTLGQGRSIYTTTGIGPGAIVSGVEAAFTSSARNGLFTFARGHVDFLSTTSAAWTPVFASGSVPFVRGRKETPTSTTRTASARVRVSSGAGTTGTVRMTMASGDVQTFAITSAMAAAWVDNDLDIACDDLSTGALTDSCLIEWQRTGGANSINLHSIAIGNG